MSNILKLTILFFAVGVLQACTLKTSDIITQDNTILDAYWMLISLEGQDVPKSQDNRMAYIRFEEKENDVFGYTGCNKFSGKYKVGDENLTMSELRSTRMACAGMDTETKLLDILSRVDGYRISKNVLTLYDGGKAVATFMTGNPDTLDNDPGRYK
ncbi:META domain-containing protein [Pontibacter sp. MBLB2868]|uniref:META domain-containing protein n=1 Tax=Pontibacter sp. MBLB2868 TaxID=3451555 RepID=UPI003F74DB96